MIKYFLLWPDLGLREVFKKKKKKKCGIFHISVFYPPLRQNVEIYSFFFTIFLDVLALFFAFLDISDHLEAKKKKKRDVENHPILPPPPVKMWKIPHFFFFFFLNTSLREILFLLYKL